MGADTGVVVYGRPGCGACLATRCVLASRGVGFIWRDVSADESAAAQAETIAGRIGSRHLPVVVLGGRERAGFRKERLDAITSPGTERAP